MNRQKQKMSSAEAYVEAVGYENERQRCEMLNDFCAGWEQAVEKACEFIKNNANDYVYAEYNGEELTGDAHLSDNFIEQLKRQLGNE